MQPSLSGAESMGERQIYTTDRASYSHKQTKRLSMLPLLWGDTPGYSSQFLSIGRISIEHHYNCVLVPLCVGIQCPRKAFSLWTRLSHVVPTATQLTVSDSHTTMSQYFHFVHLKRNRKTSAYLVPEACYTVTVMASW